MHKDISEIWKEWNTADVWSHIGICPMFGKNPNGKVFTIEQFGKILSEYKPVEINTELTGQTENIDDL